MNQFNNIRYKINEYSSEIPKLGNLLTSEITPKGLAKTLLTGTLATSLLACGNIVPQRINLIDTTLAGQNNMNIADFTANYVDQESRKDAAKVNRERRCLYDMVGKKYSSNANMFKELNSCTIKKEKIDKYANMAIATLIDGSKIALMINGLNSNGGETKIIEVKPTGGFGTSTHTTGNGF